MSSRDTDPTAGRWGTRDLARVSVSVFPGVDVVSVTGDFDMLSESPVRRLVSDPRRVTRSEVVLDLSGVTFMDARGLSAIVYSKRTLAARSANLSLVCPEGQARRVLDLLDFEQVLPIYPDRESALLQISNSQDPLGGSATIRAAGA